MPRDKHERKRKRKKRKKKKKTAMSMGAYLNAIYSPIMKMEMILSRWLRQCQIEGLSMDVGHLIINRFTFHPMFAADDHSQPLLHEMTPELAQTFCYEFWCKLLILGVSGIGKTSLMRRYVEKVFVSSALAYPVPFGMDYQFKTVHHDGDRIQLQIRDCPPRKYSRNIREYFNGVAAALLCYDITDRQSLFEGVTLWNELCDKEAMLQIRKVLVGTKCDLNALRQCTMEDAQSIARKCGAIHVIETSSKQNINISTVFDYIIHDITRFIDQKRKCPFYG